MESRYEYRVLLACDIAASAGRGEAALQQIRGVLEAACRGAFQAAGLDWSRCLRQDTGDGFQVVALPGIRKQLLLNAVLPELAALVRAHNRTAADSVRLRLRVALHAGEVRLEPDGGVSGAPFEVLARLLNAAPVREALREAPEGVPVAAILSQHFGEEAVGHGDDGPDADAFVPVEVREKKYVGHAWVHYPGCPIAPRAAAGLGEPVRKPVREPVREPGLEPGQPAESQGTAIEPPPAASAVQKNRAGGHGQIYAVQSGTLHINGQGGR